MIPMSEIPGWDKVIRKLPKYPGIFVVYHMPGESRWTDIALSHWQGQCGPHLLLKKHDWGGETYCDIVGTSGQRYLFKLFRLKDLYSLRYFHRCRRARKAVLQSLRLKNRGFLVPQTKCVLERRIAGITVSSMLIQTWLNEAVPMTSLFCDIMLSTQQRRQCLRDFGRLLAKFHSSGLYHGDLQFRNILCRITTDHYDYYWIDNERGRHFSNLPIKHRVKDLAQLNRSPGRLSAQDRMRIGKAYVTAWSLSRTEAKRFFKAVVRRTRQLS